MELELVRIWVSEDQKIMIAQPQSHEGNEFSKSVQGWLSALSKEPGIATRAVLYDLRFFTGLLSLDDFGLITKSFAQMRQSFTDESKAEVNRAFLHRSDDAGKMMSGWLDDHFRNAPSFLTTDNVKMAWNHVAPDRPMPQEVLKLLRIGWRYHLPWPFSGNS